MRKNIFLLSAILLSVFFVRSQTTDTCHMKLGMNLFSIRGGTFNFDMQQPFANVVKGCDTWITQTASGVANTTNSGQLNLFSFTADGYPTQVPVSGITVCARMLLNTNVSAPGGTFSYPGGTYNVTYSGTGALRFGGDASGPDITTGIGTINVTPTANGINMKIVLSDINDPVHDIKVMLPNHLATDTFNSAFLAKINPFTTLRFMEWNNNNTNMEKKWSDRRTATYYTQSASGGTYNYRGIAWEYAITLCNQLKKDCWVSVPTRADTNYILQMATLFRDKLDPTLKIYLEYSNECWNNGFAANYNWIDSAGPYSSTQHPRNVAHFFKKTFNLWDSVFQSQMPARVVRVCSGWGSNPGITAMQTMISDLTPSGYDAISVGPYVMPNNAAYTGLNNLCSTLTTWTLNHRMDTLCTVGRQVIYNSMNWLKQFNSIASNNSKQFIFYEGGPDITRSGFTCPAMQVAVDSLQNNMRMYDLYGQWLDSLRTLSKATLFNHFTLAGSGPMGVLANIHQPTSLKYQVLTNYIDSCGVSTGLSVMPHMKASFSVAPNPFSESTTIQVSNKDLLHLHVKIYNLYGKEIEDLEIIDKATELKTAGLSPGVYFITLFSSAGRPLGTQKVIIL